MIKKIFFGILIIILDLTLYIIIGLILLNYEDFYHESKGVYWGLSSMTLIEKIAYISYYLLLLVNILSIAYFFYRLLKKYIIIK